MRVLGGHLADRWRRLKAVAGFGYGLSAVCKLGLVAAGSSVAAIGVVLAADRTGKGLRTAPRDALISLFSEPDALGRSFGVHRALDTVGAFLGLRATGMAVVQTGQAVARMLSSVLFGLAWTLWDLRPAVLVAAVCLAAVAVAAAFVKPVRP